MDLEVDVPVQTFLSDLEGDQTYYRITGSSNGSASLSGDGQFVLFLPDAGYSGPASFRIIADDGFTQSPEVTIDVNVSDAQLLKIYFPRLAELERGTTHKLQLSGDFADELGVELPANYFEFLSSDANVADITPTGVVRALNEGTTILTAQSHGIQAVNALSVFSVQLIDGELYSTGDDVIDPGIYPGSLTLVNNGGLRQLKVTDIDGFDITAAATGTQYFIANSEVATVTPDGLVMGLVEGVTTLSIINGAGQRDIEIKVQVPSNGPTVITQDGGAVRGADGSLVLVGPGALNNDATVSITALAEADLPLSTPGSVDSAYGVFPQNEALLMPLAGLEFAGAFQLELGVDRANQPVQLAIPVASTITAGTEVFFYRYFTFIDDQGVEQNIWLLEENGVVGDDGVARTSSPPYNGATDSGTYIVTTAITNVVEDAVLVGPAGLPGLAVRYGLTFGIAYFSFDFDKTYRDNVDLVTVDNSGSTLRIRHGADIPVRPSVANNLPPVPVVNGANIENGFLTITGEYFGGSLDGDIRVEIKNFGDESPVVINIENMTVDIAGTSIIIDVPGNIVTGAADFQVVRVLTRLEPTTQTIRLDSKPFQIEPQTGLTLVALRDSVVVLKPTTAGFDEIKDIPIENGIYGFRTTPIAYSDDNSLAFVASRNGVIHVIDMVSLEEFGTIDLASSNGASNITSLAASGNFLYVAEGNRYSGSSGTRLIRVNINPFSQHFLQSGSQQQLNHESLSKAPLGIFNIAVSKDGRYLVATVPQQKPLLETGRASFNEKDTGNLLVIDLHSITDGSIGVLKDVVFPPDVRGSGKAPMYVEASSDANKFLISSALDVDRGLYTLELTRNLDNGSLVSAEIKQEVRGSFGNPNILRVGGLFQSQQLNIQRSHGIAVTKDLKYAFVSDFNLRFNDQVLKNATLPKLVGGKIGVIRDPFGLEGTPELLGVTTPIPDVSIDQIELTADGKQLIANMRNWDGASGILVFDAAGLIDAADSIVGVVRSNFQGLDTIYPSLKPKFTSMGSWIYGISTQNSDIEAVTKTEGYLGDIVRVDILNSDLISDQLFTSKEVALSQLTDKLTLSDFLKGGKIKDSSTGNLVAFTSARINGSNFRISWNGGDANDDLGAVLATFADDTTTNVIGGSQGEEISAIHAGTERAPQFSSDSGVFYIVPTLTDEQMQQLRAGRFIDNQRDGRGRYSVSISFTREDGTVFNETISGDIFVKLKDAERANRTASPIFFGDRDMKAPGYTSFGAGAKPGVNLSGSVGVSQNNNPLDVYRVEQRLRYFGFPAMGYGNPSRANNVIQEFDVDGQFGDRERRALKLFEKVVRFAPGEQRFRYDSNGADGLIEDNTLSGEGRLTLDWLNAYNAPHWMEIFGTDANGRGLASNPQIPGWSSSQQGWSSARQANESVYAWEIRTGRVERYGTSWMRDLMVAKSYAPITLHSSLTGIDNNGQPIYSPRTPIFNGVTDANYGYTLGGHQTHDLGMALDVDVNQYIGRPNRNDATIQDPTIQITGSGWSLTNAETWSGLLPDDLDNGRALNGQQQALRNFLSLYAVTQSETWGNLPITNGNAVRDALFGGGTAADDDQTNGLIENVLIGGQGNAQNPYANMRLVLRQLGVPNTSTVRNATPEQQVLLSGTASGHQTHLHIYLRPPELVSITQNLLADNAVLGQTQKGASEELFAAAQVLLDEIQPQLNFDQGDVNMFVMDIPPDVPTQYATVVIAQATQVQKSKAKTDRTVGICQALSNPAMPGIPGATVSAYNTLTPPLAVKNYFRIVENRTVKGPSTVTVLEKPKHGELEDMGTFVTRHGVRVDTGQRSYSYLPNSGYLGKDRATLLVEIGGFKVKLVYFFQVEPVVDYKVEEIVCPNSPYWKISVNPNDPGGPLLTNMSSLPTTNTFAGITRPTLVFADLPGNAVGQTIGNTITLDINAAGNGWFIDSTPGMNEEFVATSNPNEWVARVGSAAEGKMDLLTVLAHEVGHVYGLPHSTDNASLMSEDLKPGVRHTISLDDLKALWARLSDSVVLNTNNSSTPGTPFDPLPLVPSLFFGFNRLRLRGDVGQGIALPPLQNEPHTLVATPAPIFSMTSQNATALHTNIFNGDFSVIDPANDQFGWTTRGRVNFDGGEAVLVEDERAMTGLTQTFILPDKFQSLKFTITGMDFGANGLAPMDAFEMALIDAATGQSALGLAPLSQTDAMFNIQSDGTVYAAPGVSINGLPSVSGSLLSLLDPIEISIDLTALTPGSVLTTYFDLLGLGVANSRISIDNVRIVSNSPPVAKDDTVLVDEDITIDISVLANDTDAENDPLVAILINAPQNGIVVQNPNGTFTYTPNANYFGSDSFTYKANDGEFDSNLATVSITINPVNDAPVVGDIANITAEDTAVIIDLLANASDIDSTVLTPVIVDAPVNGVLVMNTDGTVTYTPHANYFGSDSFTYKVRDEELDSNLATVSINVTPVNDAPQGVDNTVTTLEDNVYIFILADFGFSDVNDAPVNSLLAVKITTVPMAGNLSLNGFDVVAGQYVAAAEIAAGLFQFTPAPDANGTAYTSFGFQVQDDGGTANGGVDLDPLPKTLTIDVIPVNDAPVAISSTVTGNEDQPYVFTWEDFNINDIDSIDLSLIINTLPTSGQLQVFDGAVWTAATVNQAMTQAQIETGTLRFIPAAHESGFDGFVTTGAGNLKQDYAQFTYQASDGELLSETATITIDIVPVADAPTLTITNPPDRYGATSKIFRTSWESVINRSPKQTLVKATELEGWTLVKAPRPNDSDQDHDEDDVHGRTSTPEGINAAGDRKPGAADDHKHKHGHYGEDDDDRKQDHHDKDRDSGQDVFKIWSSGDKMANASTGSDKDNDDHKHGHHDKKDEVQERTNTAGAGRAGAVDDHHRDKKHDSDDFKKSHNDGDDNDHCDKRDDDDDAPYSRVYAAPGNGENWLELNDAKGEGHQTIGIERTVSTRAGATYELSFDYAGRLGYSTDYTRIGIYVDDVLIGNYAGTSPNDALNWESLSFSFVGTGGEQLIRIVTEPLAIEKNGRGAMIDNIALIEQLPLNTGYEDNTIKLSAINAALVDTDGSEVLNLFIEAMPVGAVITDGTNSFTALQGDTTADITAWDVNNMSITPPQDFFGEFVLNVRATATEMANGDTASTLNTLTVTVIGINDAPVASDDSVTTDEDTPITINALANDVDVDQDVLTTSLIAGPQNGSVVLNADGNFRYTPKANFFGIDSFSYRLNDGALDSNIATVTINITPVNDAPTAQSRTYVLEIEGDDDKHRHDDHDRDHKDKHDGKRKGGHHSHDDDDKHKHKYGHEDGNADRGGLKIDLVALVSDVDGDPLTLTVGTPSNGTLVQNTDGIYRYIPNQGFTGADSFTYTVSDGELTTTATIRIIVKGEADDHPHKHNGRGHHHHDNDTNHDSRVTVHSTLPKHANKKHSDHPKSILVNWPEHDPIIVHNPHTSGPRIDWAGWESRREENNKDDNKRQHKDWEPKGWIGEFLEPNKHSSLAEQTGIKIEMPKNGKHGKD